MLLARFDPSNAAQRQAVCGALKVFVAAAQSRSGHGLDPAVAARWIADANRISSVLGCA